MNSIESLYLIVEASLALAGFAGIVTVLSKRGASELSPIHRLNLVNLLATSFGALFMSLTAMVMLAAAVAEPFVWRTISIAGLLTTLYFTSKSIRTIMAAEGQGHQRLGPARFLAINLPLLLVCLVQVWNVIGPGEFWPVLLLLVALFGIGCLSFVRLLFAPVE